MKTIEKEETKTVKVTFYISVDGKEFRDQKKCEQNDLKYWKSIFNELPVIDLAFEDISVIDKAYNEYGYYEKAYRISNEIEFEAFYKCLSIDYTIYDWFKKEFKYTGEDWYFIRVDRRDHDFLNEEINKPPVYLKKLTVIKSELNDKLIRLDKQKTAINTFLVDDKWEV